MRMPWRKVWRWYKSTSNRTFIVYPIAVIAFELGLRRGALIVHPAGALLLIWGYLQYRLVGRYRVANGGGGPGLDVPPKCIVIAGPYRYTRNPLYLGPLIFFAGLALRFYSLVAGALPAFSSLCVLPPALNSVVRLGSRIS